MNRSRAAVLIADSFGSPFEELKSEIQPLIWNFASDVDVYYMRGHKPNRFSEMQNKTSEKLRYSNLWPIQRITDNLLLSRKSRHIPSVSVTNSDLKVDVNEGLRNLGLKSLSAYNFLFESGYEIFYKTTLSSLVHPKQFMALIDTIPKQTPCYTGTVIKFGNKPFISGANLILNRKAVKILLQKQNHWQHGLLDDVAIGRLLAGFLNDFEIKTLNIHSLAQVENLTKQEIESNMHFRCKSSNTNRDDVQIMRRLISKMDLE